MSVIGSQLINNSCGDNIYFIGDRIANRLGVERALKVFEGYESGKYSSLREESLYFARTSEGLHIPAKSIDLLLSKELLLISIEILVMSFGVLPQKHLTINCRRKVYLKLGVPKVCNWHINVS